MIKVPYRATAAHFHCLPTVTVACRSWEMGSCDGRDSFRLEGLIDYVVVLH